MSQTYASMTTLVVSKLQSGGTADYSVAEVDAHIATALGELSQYQPHLVPMRFRLESRYGADVTGTSSKLTDLVKLQFLSTDVGKVVHNLTDDTWGVVTGYTSTSVLSISKNMMAANEEYRLYNQECWNEKQIYLGNVPENYVIESVEYPVGTKRNWKRFGRVVEIDVDFVDDSDSTLDNLGKTLVLVWFSKPHVVSQLTDWQGQCAATAATGATTLSMNALQTSGTVHVGDEFTVMNTDGYYVVAESSVIAASTTVVTFYPPLDSPVSASTGVYTYFTKTTLEPYQEDLTADLAASRLAIDKSPKFINSVVIGANVWSNLLAWGEHRLAETLSRLRRSTPPKTKKRYATDR